MPKRTATVTVRLDPDHVALLTDIRDRLDPTEDAVSGALRAALHHVSRKRDEAVKQADQNYAELEAMWESHRVTAGQRDEAVRRAERAEDERDAYQGRIAELESSLANREDIIKVRTRERDEALAWGPSVADNWRRRYRALRDDVDLGRWTSAEIIARDDQRMQADA